MKRDLSLLFLAVIAAYVLGGCKTVQGAGKDIQKAGDAIERAGSK